MQEKNILHHIVVRKLTSAAVTSVFELALLLLGEASGRRASGGSKTVSFSFTLLSTLNFDLQTVSQDTHKKNKLPTCRQPHLPTPPPSPHRLCVPVSEREIKSRTFKTTTTMSSKSRSPNTSRKLTVMMTVLTVARWECSLCNSYH